MIRKGCEHICIQFHAFWMRKFSILIFHILIEIDLDMKQIFLMFFTKATENQEYQTKIYVKKR